MGKYEEMNKELGCIVTLTQTGLMSIDKGMTEVNILLKENGLEQVTKEQYIQKFIPPQPIKMTPEKMQELQKQAKAKAKATEKAKKEVKKEVKTEAVSTEPTEVKNQ